MHPTADTVPVIISNGAGRRVMPGVSCLHLCMNESGLNKLVDVWVAGQEVGQGTPQYQDNWWAISRFLGWAVPENEPELLW